MYLALRCCREEEEETLQKHTVGFLLRFLLFHWRFSIYLSDQVIEDLQEEEMTQLQKRLS